MDEETNLRIVQELYAAFARADVPAMLARLDPEVTWVNPGPDTLPYFGAHRGHEAVMRNIFGFLAEQLQIHAMQPTDIFAKGERVIVLLHMEATALKTGRKLVQEVVHAFTLKNDRVVHFHDYQDNSAVLAALR